MTHGLRKGLAVWTVVVGIGGCGVHDPNPRDRGSSGASGSCGQNTDCRLGATGASSTNAQSTIAGNPASSSSDVAAGGVPSHPDATDQGGKQTGTGTVAHGGIPTGGVSGTEAGAGGSTILEFGGTAGSNTVATEQIGGAAGAVTATTSAAGRGMDGGGSSGIAGATVGAGHAGMGAVSHAGGAERSGGTAPNAGQAGTTGCPELNASSLVSANVAVELAESLVAEYRLDGNGADSSRFANDVVTTGLSYGSDRFDHPNSALQLEGGDNAPYAYRGFQDPSTYPLYGASAFTISAWIKTDVASAGTIVSMVSPGRAFVMSLDSALGGSLSAHFALDANAYYIAYANVTKPLVGKWLFATAVWSGCRWGLYLDAWFVGERVVQDGAVPPLKSREFAIGAPTPGTGFDGLIDEVRIHRRALSSGEIKWLMQQP